MTISGVFILFVIPTSVARGGISRWSSRAAAADRRWRLHELPVLLEHFAVHVQRAAAAEILSRDVKLRLNSNSIILLL